MEIDMGLEKYVVVLVLRNGHSVGTSHIIQA